jgi:hypothetical protein
MTDEIFTPEQVASLWAYQFGPGNTMHPFTCGNRDDHPEIAGDKGILVPTTRGWICPICDYKQDWAHDFMLIWKEKHEYDTKNPTTKDLAHVCAGRIVRLIELDAPEPIMRTELKMLGERIDELLKK